MGTRLCLPNIALRGDMIWEFYVGVVGHFGIDKIIAMIEDCFYWPSLKRDLAKIIR